MIQKFKRRDGFRVGYNYTQADLESTVSRALEWSKIKPKHIYLKTYSIESFQASQPKDGIFQEKPRALPKKHVWIPKPKHLQTSLDSLPGPSHTKEPTPEEPC
ncbi:hypothetical protein GUJ93_ZPchr0006g44170 [Zizania palustris]|uniref:Uncharacterized protein n=1 Tax=Zizania palustris TaxID=103762 RepID=A0A8J5SM44_ZIZPA|nr:hypothetical protein GUJ93_ZPchr0006g44170 [Zizania palustris]